MENSGYIMPWNQCPNYLIVANFATPRFYRAETAIQFAKEIDASLVIELNDFEAVVVWINPNKPSLD